MKLSDGAFPLATGTPVTFDAPAEDTARYFVDLVRRTTPIEMRARSGRARRRGVHFELTAAEGASNAEGYSLQISPERVLVSASAPRGLFYGAVSLWQLIAPTDAESVLLPAASIYDTPRFGWRGLMLDSARHYQSPEFIRKLIDAMALHKLNVLHWHLTDDQAWRLEIKQYPKLTSVGAWRVPAGPAAAADIDPATGEPRKYGGFYSQDEVRELVAYAAERHITIVPEIETPGHASAAIAAYPRLAAAEDPGDAPPADWGVYPNLFNVDEATFQFLENVLSEVVALFPSEYIHIGGDEAVKDQWRASPAVQARMRELGLKDEHALQSWFIQRLEQMLSARGRRLIGWDEILEGGLAPNATVMSWRGVEGAVAAAQAGHDAVLSPGPTLYFDNRPLDAARPGRGRIVSVQDVYAFDPAPDALTEPQRAHILGVQANVWTEHIRTEKRVEYMTFPRLAALAEVAWSTPEQRDWRSFEARLPAQLARYDALDLAHASSPAMKPKINHRTSHQLRLCSEKLVLSLEDDAPVQGERAVFLVDIMDPCWVYPQVDLSRTHALEVVVGQAPFNFQIGADVEKIPLRAPRSPGGELEVRLDDCAGDVLATAALAPAQGNHALTRLPTIQLPSRAGVHDLCFTFTRARIDPIWAIDSIVLVDAGRS